MVADDEKPVRRVQIGKPFYLGKYPVTQAQWETVMGNNPSRFKGEPNRPVETVSWYEAQEFLRKLSAREGGSRIAYLRKRSGSMPAVRDLRERITLVTTKQCWRIRLVH